VRDFSPPQLRPRAKTVPRFIWKRPPGYVKPRSDLSLPPRDSRGRFQSRQRLGGVVIGESDDSQVGSWADLLEASSSPSWDGFGFSDEHLDGTAVAGDWSTVAQLDASLVQPEAPVLEAEDILSVVPEGRESAETTMNQEEAAGPSPADAGAAAAVAEAARLDAIEKRQDEAEEILYYLERAILPVVETITTARMADEFAQRVDETIARLGKCHTFLRRRDRVNHEADLGPRIEEASANLGDILVNLTQLRATETEEEEESEPEPERPPDPPPIVVSKGPTAVDVAGGKTIMIPYGDERFHLQIEDGDRVKATITGLRMPHVTTPFPLVKLKEAWLDVCEHAKNVQPNLCLPTIDAEVGGRELDILLGIKYVKYFPRLVYSLPGGLQIYRAVLKSDSPNQAVLGGPHKAWSRMLDMAQHMNPRAYLMAEARAWIVKDTWARLNQGKLSSLERFVLDEPAEEASGRRITDGSASGGCLHCKCEEDAENFIGVYSASQEEKQFWKVEDLGTESPYRCLDCRNCPKCRNGEELEAISFKEEAEQALIEDSVQLTQGTTWCGRGCPSYWIQLNI
jgi:hypothetical protein